MTQWWTYGLSDFLMFSPETYWRMVARHNAAWWPAQLVAAAVPAVLLTLVRSRAAWSARAATLVLALAWAWVAWAFHWRHYAEIFLGAPWTAAASAVQALLLAACALFLVRAAQSIRGSVGPVLLVLALLYPLLAPLTGHPWDEAEVFAFMPEPTALATLGCVLEMRPWPAALRALLAIVPVLSLTLGAATRWLLA